MGFKNKLPQFQNRLERELFAKGYSKKQMRGVLLVPFGVELEEYFKNPHKYMTLEAAQRAAYVLGKNKSMFDIIKLVLNMD